MSLKHFQLEMQPGGVAWLCFVNKNSSLNILEEEALLELNDVLAQLSKSPGVKGLVFYSGKEDQFIAGADISEIEKLTQDPENPERRAKEGSMKMQSVLQKLSELKVPTVCAIHGACLGGGLELALSCDYRVASHGSVTKLGLPEVKLGLLPGAGGTQRLPRLIGMITALDLITTGKEVAAKKALKLGLVDAICAPQRLLSVATEFTDSKTRRKKRRKKSWLQKLIPLALERNPLGRKFVYKKAKKAIEKQTKGFYPAPHLALKAVVEGYSLPLNLGLKKEARYFAKLSVTQESKACIHLYHATQHIKKTPFASPSPQSSSESESTEEQVTELAKDPSEDNSEKNSKSSHPKAESPQVQVPQKVAIIGGGFMGAGIATICAARGVNSLISDPSSEAIGKALRYVKKYFDKRVKRRRLKPFEASQRLASIYPTLRPVGLKKADVVIEAVPEDLKLKQSILKDLEEQSADDWVFASNTSALPIAEIAAAAKRPERVVGMHFFSPVEKMPLLEVIKAPKSDHGALYKAVKLGQKLGKQVIVVRDGPGFYTTRALAFYLAEAIQLLEQGAQVELIDTTMTQFGFPVGPLALLDEVGIDVGIHVLDTMTQAFPGRIQKSSHVAKLVEQNRLGRKTSKGIYKYTKSKKSSSSDGLKKAGVDPEIYKIFAVSENSASPSADEIRERLSLIFVAESLRCLDEEILDHPYDGDVGAVFGLGFPPFLGGPFHYVDRVGARAILSSLSSLQRSHGVRFEPPDSLKKNAKDDLMFFPRDSH